MAWYVVNVEFVFDQRSHPLGCPVVYFPAVGLCSVFKQLEEWLSIFVIKLQIRALIIFVIGAFETLNSLFFQRRIPIRNSRWRYTVILSDLSLTLIGFQKLLSSGYRRCTFCSRVSETTSESFLLIP